MINLEYIDAGWSGSHQVCNKLLERFPEVRFCWIQFLWVTQELESSGGGGSRLVAD